MKSLAVKYRPTTFNECIGQQSVISILNRQIELKEFKNAYLFTGISGTGKTTVARIFASKINEGVGCPIEIDAASNNGVESVRTIVEDANRRSLDSKYKIYILDECHVFTVQSWQAFLKCIEEPPAYTIFIFCTTNPEKIPATIINRCMRFNFTRLSTNLIIDRLNYICEKENFINYQDSVKYIAKICKGQCRDAIALLEKVADYSTNFNIETTLSVLGLFSYSLFIKLINSLIDGNEARVFEVVKDCEDVSNNAQLFIEQFLEFCLDVDKYILFSNINLTSIPSSFEEDIKKSINFKGADNYYLYVVNKLLDLKNMLKNDTNPFNTIEVVFLQICRLKN